MAFSINDLQDLIALLAEKPEWRAQLRPLILGDEFDRLPQTMQELAEAQRRTEVRVVELGEAITGLAVEQRALVATVERLGQKVDSLTDAVKLLTGRMDEDTGALYEIRFERKAPSLFGRWLRRPTAITLNDLEKVDAAEASGTLSEVEADALRELDLLVSGRDKRELGQPETILAVEVSRTLDSGDIDRAIDRALILERIGYRALPAVGGKFAPDRIRDEAARRGVILRLIDHA